MNCRGCDEPLTPAKAPGRRKVWCSDRCRRRTLYTNACDCGAVIYDGSAKPPTVCGECKYEAAYGERNAEILRRWEAGETGRQIGAALGMTEAAVLGWVEKCRQRGDDIPLHRGRNRASWPEIERRWNAGESGPQIAAALETTAHNLWVMVKTMRRAGHELEFRQRPRRQDWLEIERRWQAGETYAQIGEAIDRSPGSVGSVVQSMRVAGIALPRRRPGRRAATA